MPDERLRIVVEEVQKGEDELKEVQQDLDGITASEKKTSAGLGNLTKGLLAAGAAVGAMALAKSAYDLGVLGAQAERTEQGFETISGGAMAAEENLNAMIAATAGAIDRTTAMGLANQMMQMGLANNADELAKNAEMATRLGAAMGTDAIPAMENWNAMLANQSLPRLDTYGISSGKVRTRINELMAATEGLTRETAFNIAVMAEGEIAMARLGDRVEDNALSIEQAAAAMADLKVELGKEFASAVGGANTAVGKFTRTWGDNLRIMREGESGITRLQANFGMLDDAIGTSTSVFDEFREAEENAERSTKELALRLEFQRQMAQSQIDPFNDTTVAVEQYNEAIAGAAGTANDFATAQRNSAEAAMNSELAYLQETAALSELSVAGFVAQKIRELTKAEEDGKISSDELTAATRELLQQTGLLTEKEIIAQEKTARLDKAFADGRLTAIQYAAAVKRLKDELDGLQDKDVTLTMNVIRKTTTLDESAPMVDPGTGSAFNAAGGFIPQGGSGFVGDGGMERIEVTNAGARVTPVTNNNNVTNVFPAGASPIAVTGMEMALFG